WDLRGAAGISGPGYGNKAYALPHDLLADARGEDELAAWFTDGGAGLPGLGAVLETDAIRSIARFVVEVRDGALPHPDWIWELRANSPGNYALGPGADAARGGALFAERCADCHGADGTELLFDDGAYSLGTHARQKAYEDWFKILNGQPGTDMGRQVDGDARAMGQQILDLLAALCDRAAFPPGAASGADVADGDPRCGAYLR
ncbi:MAG: hypothetical protein R2939_18775, partial [Kofleriaceae bacterium]